MRNTVIWSFLSLVALASGGLMAGCDSDEKLARSALGESCAKTSDCDDGLRCYQGTCYKAPTGSAGSSTGAGGDGSEPVGPKPPVLGGEGESCGRAADCEEGLGCFSGRCSKAEAGGEGGEGNGGGVKLGGKGETCGLTSDCQKGLACLPSDGVIFPDALAIGSNSVGVCTPTDNGLEPTGKQCGAECKTNDDCCELPFELHATLGAESCADLAALVPKDCAAAVAGTLPAQRCFAQATYCECGKTTWTCEAGQCNYTAACKVDVANSPGGCPTVTRVGRDVSLNTCDTKAKKCSPKGGTCKVDDDCFEAAVADVALATCADGECTCYVATGKCYRKCDEDVDCRAGYACDTDTSVCVPDNACKSDAECVTRFNDIRAKCFDGVCDVECNTDLDCNHGALTAGTATRICNAKQRCELVGCTEDSECGGTINGVRYFCGEALMGASGGVESAITD